MSKTGKKTNWVAIVLLLIILAGGVFGAYHFTNGFKDNPFTKPGTDSPGESGKELVSTTYVTEKYGTFELSANSMILNFSEIQRDLLFENGTNFNYLMDETIELFNSFNLSEPLVKEDCVVGILAETGTNGKFIDDGYATFVRNTYLKLSKNTLIYSTDRGPIDLKYESFPTILVFDKEGNHDNDKTLDFLIKVFVQDYEYKMPDVDYIFKSPVLVISDKGVPLTEKIYKEILEDPTTQIIKNYKE